MPTLAAYDGMVWYRARVKLTAAQAKQAATLSLGVIDDVDVVWVNGQPMGSGFGEARACTTFPPKLLEAGDNLVVVNVFDMWGSGGMHGHGRAARTAIRGRHERPRWRLGIPVAAGEVLQPAARALGADRRHEHSLQRHDRAARKVRAARRGLVPGRGQRRAGRCAALPGAAADAVRRLAPAFRFRAAVLRGAARELECAGDHARGQRLGAAARCAAARGGGGWQCRAGGHHRPRQSRRHPSHQQTGRGQAAGACGTPCDLWGKDFSVGARAEEAKRTLGGVEVTLGDFDGSLLVIGAKDPAGFELCGDTQASCHFVRAQLGEGGVVRLDDSAPEKATRVRFCWADAPLCNLFDTEGLPVGPFEIRCSNGDIPIFGKWGYS